MCRPCLLSWKQNGICGIMWWVFLNSIFQMKNGWLRVEKKLAHCAWPTAWLVGGWGVGQTKWQARWDRALVLKDLEVWPYKDQCAVVSTHINPGVRQTWLEPWTSVLLLIILGTSGTCLTYLRLNFHLPNNGIKVAQHLRVGVAWDAVQ